MNDTVLEHWSSAMLVAGGRGPPGVRETGDSLPVIGPIGTVRVV